MNGEEIINVFFCKDQVHFFSDLRYLVDSSAVIWGEETNEEALAQLRHLSFILTNEVREPVNFVMPCIS